VLLGFHAQTPGTVVCAKLTLDNIMAAHNSKNFFIWDFLSDLIIKQLEQLLGAFTYEHTANA
jgi:hypothetical protein